MEAAEGQAGSGEAPVGFLSSPRDTPHLISREPWLGVVKAITRASWPSAPQAALRGPCQDSASPRAALMRVEDAIGDRL